MSVESVIDDYRRRREHRLRERMEQIENPVDKFYLLKVIYKGEGSRHHPSAAKDGGSGSGYEDHPGRPGEVGGSLKSANAANSEIADAYSKGDTTSLKSVIRSSLTGAALGTTVKMTFSSGETLSLKKTDDNRYEYEKGGKTYTANTMYLIQNLNTSSLTDLPVLADPEVEERKELVKTSQAAKKAAKKSSAYTGSTSLSADTPYTTENEKETEESNSSSAAELNKKLEEIAQMSMYEWPNQYTSAFESADIGTQIKMGDTIYTKAENDVWTKTGSSGKEQAGFSSSKSMAYYANAAANFGYKINAVDPEISVGEANDPEKSAPEEPALAVNNKKNVKPVEVYEGSANLSEAEGSIPDIEALNSSITDAYKTGDYTDVNKAAKAALKAVPVGATFTMKGDTWTKTGDNEYTDYSFSYSNGAHPTYNVNGIINNSDPFDADNAIRFNEIGPVDVSYITENEKEAASAEKEPAVSSMGSLKTVDDISEALQNIDLDTDSPESEVQSLIEQLPAGTILFAGYGYNTIILKKQKDGSFMDVEGSYLMYGETMSTNEAASVLTDYGDISAEEGVCTNEFENANFARDEDGNVYRNEHDGYFKNLSTGEIFTVDQLVAFGTIRPVSEKDVKRNDIETAIQEHWGSDGPDLRGHIALGDIEVPESGIDDDDHLREVQIARDTGLDADTCAEIRKAVWDFTGSAYREIRKAQQNGEESGHYAEQGKLLETFIDNAPTWAGDGEPLYRGVRISRDVLEEWLGKIETGETIDQLGTASWSTSYGVSAENFARWDSGNTSAVILVNDSGETHGTSIEAYSQFYDEEEEVLVSKRSRQVLTGYEIEHGEYGETRTIIHCYEVLEDL